MQIKFCILSVFFAADLILMTENGDEKREFCNEIFCRDEEKISVCGIREEGEGVRFRLFENECALLEYGCQVDETQAYGLINIEYCETTLNMTRPFARNENNAITEGDQEVKEMNQNDIDQERKDDYENNVNKKQEQIQNEIVEANTELEQLVDGNIEVSTEPELIKDEDIDLQMEIEQAQNEKNVERKEREEEEKENKEKENQCSVYECSFPGDTVCGVRNDGEGFRIKLFPNLCQLLKYNCLHRRKFNKTEIYVCDDLTGGNAIEKYSKRIVVLNNTFFNYDDNINETINNFFAGTHILDMPLIEIGKQWNETTRRRIVTDLGPVVVFKPFTRIPKNRTDDREHLPTLNSCYHKCPRKCPDTYAPVCGMPGIIAREPTIMFQNHCFMDIAQCKMFWENKSFTALSSTYVETTFLFCLGDAYNAVYRFLPLVRTLQRMGRLKKKGFFKYKIRNMKFLNELLVRDMNVQG